MFPFTCSTGLTFDIKRQICDRYTPVMEDDLSDFAYYEYKVSHHFRSDKVSNCDISVEESVPKPLLNTEEPICSRGQTACGDG